MIIHALLLAAAFAPSSKTWEAGVAFSYVRAGSFDGPGFSVQSLWAPSDYFALGPILDLAYLSSDLSASAAGNNLPASYAFTSTIAGGLAQFRLPLGLVEPYAGLALGYDSVSIQHSANVQCRVSSGFGMLFAVGGRAALGDHLSVGLRGSARSPEFLSCTAMAGPAAFGLPFLFALSSTFDYRW